MSQMHLHTTSNAPATVSDLPVLQKLTEAYKLWHGFFIQFPRLSRYTLGAKTDTIFTDLIELVLFAAYANRDQKGSVITKASARLDSLKFFLHLAWQLKLLDHKKYALIAPLLMEIGKMLGGWQKHLGKETPAGAGAT